MDLKWDLETKIISGIGLAELRSQLKDCEEDREIMRSERENWQEEANGHLPTIQAYGGKWVGRIGDFGKGNLDMDRRVQNEISGNLQSDDAAFSNLGGGSGSHRLRKCRLQRRIKYIKRGIMRTKWKYFEIYQFWNIWLLVQHEVVS